ncbi:MAG: ABC transporter ATP-binding protein [Planctomycetota bacterium]|jgi:putative ABC transport system ATP-binding protein
MSEEKNEVIVKSVDVTKTYQLGSEEVHALAGVSLDVYRGEYLCIMGPSGSGKSTFFNMVGALDTPSSGTLSIEGYDVGSLTKGQLAWLRCNKVGYIFQRFNLIDVLTALENVMLPLTFAGIETKEAEEKAAEVLTAVGLGHRLDHLPAEVSGGQQQRIAIARALANKPAILLADEPTGNLDLHTGEEIINLLKEMSVKYNTTVIAVTHDMKMFNVSDRVVWIRDGAIERVARRDEIDIKVGGIGGLAH